MNFHDDEIDLRPYIESVIKHWWLILILAALFAGTTYILRPKSAPIYSSTATLLLTRARGNLRIADQFQTVTEPIDAKARMDAILVIAANDAIADQVISSTGDQLPEELRTIDSLKTHVTVSSRGDTILIKGSYTDTQVAVTIANLWAEQVAKAINTAYNSEQPLGDISKQVAFSRTVYETSQKDLENAIKESKTEILNRKINALQLVLESLQTNNANELQYYQERHLALEDLLLRAEGLHNQMATKGITTTTNLGDYLYFIDMRANAYPLYTEPGRTYRSAANYTIQVPLNQATTKEQVSFSIQEVDEVIARTKNEMSEVEKKIQAITGGDGIHPTDQEIEKVVGQLLGLKLQLEAEQAKMNQFTTQRDAALKAYQALRQKEVEVKAAGDASVFINVAAAAYPAAKPDPVTANSNYLRNGVLGALLGLLWAMGVQWYRSVFRRKTLNS